MHTYLHVQTYIYILDKHKWTKSHRNFLIVGCVCQTYFHCVFLIVGRVLHEVVLNESIRYANGDPVERWLYDLLCLDATNVTRISSGCPLPESCDLYYINRDTLFSYHKASEAFLHRVMALYVSSHYKVSDKVKHQ